MDNDPVCIALKNNLSCFRVRELQECLSRLGLRTTGVKAQLLKRLNEYFAAERHRGQLTFKSPCFLIVLDIFREMRGIHAQDNARRPPSMLRCLCKRPAFETAESRLLSCATPNCVVQEHASCIFHSRRVPEWSTRDHRCFSCRSYFADPFCKDARPNYVVPPTPLRETQRRQYPSNGAVVGYKMTIMDFHLSPNEINVIRTGIWKLQVVCLQLDDEVQYRFHWPMFCKLVVNGKVFRVYPRHSDSRVTQGQRDEPTDIGNCVVAGRNSIEISCQDESLYAFCVRAAVTVEKDEVMQLMHAPENLDAAIMRMRRIVRSKLLSTSELDSGRAPVGQIVSDVDDEVQTMTSMMSLKCPFSSQRIVTPARFLNIDTLECIFDLNAFLAMAKITRKWACPHSLKQSSVQNLTRDVWLEAVLTCLQELPDVQEIEVSKEGAWRLRGESRWRSVYNTSVIESVPDLPNVSTAAVEMEIDDESEDEEEEMRQAIEAAKQACRQHHSNNMQASNMEVVDLVSSEEEAETQIPTNGSYPVVPMQSEGSVQRHSGSLSSSLSTAPYRPHNPMTNSATTMSQLALGRSDPIHPRPAPFAYPVPVAHGQGFHPVQNNPRPSNLYPMNFGVPQMQVHQAEHPIVVKNAPLNIPNFGIPANPRKRPAVSNPAFSDQMDRFSRRAVEPRTRWSPMECLEIVNLDDSDNE